MLIFLVLRSLKSYFWELVNIGSDEMVNMGGWNGKATYYSDYKCN